MCKRISDRESLALFTFSFSCFLRNSENHGGPVRCVCVCVCACVCVCVCVCVCIELVSSSTEKIQGISSPE